MADGIDVTVTELERIEIVDTVSGTPEQSAVLHLIGDRFRLEQPLQVNPDAFDIIVDAAERVVVNGYHAHWLAGQSIGDATTLQQQRGRSPEALRPGR